MNRTTKRLLWLVAGLAVAVNLLAVVYSVGMLALEGETRSFWAALEWAAETLTTTGYGADHSWRHPAMVVFVVITQFVGVFLVFLIFPIYLIPMLEERFEARVPDRVSGVSDHFVVFQYGPSVAGLIQGAQTEGKEVVVLETREPVARIAMSKGLQVALGSAGEESLERVGLDSAAALVANGSDNDNAALIVAARQSGFTNKIVAVVDDPAHQRAIRLAGATAVVTPRHEIGSALAHRASPKVASSSGWFSYGRNLRLEPIRIADDSEFAGRTLADLGLSRNWGVTAVAQWVGGSLLTDLTADSTVERGATLIVGGGDEAIAKVRAHAVGSTGRESVRHVIGGYGEVGREAVRLLRQAGEEVVVVDRDPIDGVDVVGNLRDPDVLARAEVGDAGSVILALDSDPATLFATLIVRDLAPHVPVAARVNDATNLEQIHRAGAAYAVSLDQIAGQILADHLLEEDAVVLDPRLKVACLDASSLAGTDLGRVGVREATGATIVAIERGGRLHVDLAPSFAFAEGDAAYVCGSPEAVHAAGDWLSAA